MKRVTLLPLIILLSGCFSISPEPTPTSWGMGLDTLTQPEPAPYVEGEADLAHLFAFANASIEAMYGRCRTDSKESWVHGQAAERKFRSFDYLIDACDANDRLLIKGEADAAIANGTVDGLVARYDNASQSAIDRLKPIIDALPPPGSYADAEFMAWIQETYSGAAAIHTSRRSVASYKENIGQPYNELNLDQGLIGFRGGERTMDALEYFIENYEWQPGTCAVPSADDVFARLSVRLNASIERAAQNSDPEDLKWISNPYGLVVKLLKPRVEGAHQDGWPLFLLWQQPQVDFYAAYWENYTHRPLPTEEEADYLIALHHANVRSLATETVWDAEQYWMWQAKSNAEYYDEHRHAVRPLALQAVTWPFAELNCQPATH